jgi:DNA-binding transcriptional ArsR family regulator
MATSAETLKATLGDTPYAALGALADSPGPLSGRKVAALLKVSPTTATAALSRLRDAGFAMSSRRGRAYEWTLHVDHPLIRSWLRDQRPETADEPPAGSSPYSTGGGGVTFERKVAVQYLACLLTGDGAQGLDGARRVVRVDFQQAPEHAVDDLVVHAARADEAERSLVLAIAVRRAPNLVPSDADSKKLIRAFVRELAASPKTGPEHRFALAVAGPQDHAQQLAALAALAAKQANAGKFFELVRTPKKFSSRVRDRLSSVESLVQLALADLSSTDPDSQTVQDRTWQLLSRLHVLMPRLEAPDEADWATVTNALRPVAQGRDLYGASRLRDRLIALASDYPMNAATVDVTVLRRDAHELLDDSARPHPDGWELLEHLHDRAVAAVRHDIAAADGTRTAHVDRRDEAAALIDVAAHHAAVVAHGESGVGKSALAIGAALGAAADTNNQVLCINLRHLPATTVELEAALGVGLRKLLAGMTAPMRLLVVDGADAIAEGMLEPFRHLADAARRSDVTILAVTSADVRQLVRDALADRDVAEFLIPPLNDDQIEHVVASFPELAALAANPRARELLRRPVVVDLLVRGGLSGTPLGDADAMEQVWNGLVRRHERVDRGTPDARELALLRLADLALRGGDPLEVLSALDPTAVDGLRRDGLLRAPHDDPFRIGPEFTHDELRRYAIARLLRTGGDPAAKLLAAGVPRWALAATRLACQALLAAPHSAASPRSGRFARLQRAFDGLAAAGHGSRWGDVPGEALLGLGDPDPVLLDAWPGLVAGSGEGLQRLSRLVDQRLRDDKGLVRVVALEPLIALLLDDEAPWRSGEHVHELLRDWLRALAAADTPAGHPLRGLLRDRLVAACAAADTKLQQERAAAAEALAARSPEEIAERQALMRARGVPFGEIGYPRRRRRSRAELPPELTDETVVELLALLGADLGTEGEVLLRRVAQNAPSWARPAVEEPFTGRALATYRRGFLAELAEAYYVDDEEDGSGFHEDGIRDHHARGMGVTPLAAWYRGPFMPMFQTDFRNGVAVLNRMLNHAARARARIVAGLDQPFGEPPEGDPLDQYRTELKITGSCREYIGDEHVWLWYRGTGVGPYPCMSALQALERVCDQIIEIGIPVAELVPMLLDGCENLAMLGMVVGLLVRHLESAGRLLDPFLAEPLVWHNEFTRVVHEHGGLRAPSDGVIAPERRGWSLREAAMTLVLRADDSRADEFREIGERLVATGRSLVLQAAGDTDAATLDEHLAPIRAWASALDRGTYEATATDEGLLIQSRPPADVVDVLEPGNVDIQRAQESTRLMLRYDAKRRDPAAEPFAADQLVADLGVAEDLLSNPPALGASGRWDVPAAVSAQALESRLLDDVPLPDDAVRFALETVLQVAEGALSARQHEFEESYFELGADRAAARVMGLLLTPAGADMRARLNNSGAYRDERVAAAGSMLARATANETRVHLARGLDRLWRAPCTPDSCPHQVGLRILVESMRDSAFGGWNRETGSREVLVLADPVAPALTDTPDDAIYFSRLDAAIRGFAPAAVAKICVSAPAREVLDVVLAAQRRALLAHDRNLDHRGTHALHAARSLLTLAGNGDDSALFKHIDAYADNCDLLGGLLRAASAAAEETADRAATARRLWPAVIERVLDLHDAGHTPFSRRPWGDYTLASLLPNHAGEVAYLYPEVGEIPISWWDVLSWTPQIQRWLSFARGNPRCVDHLISSVRSLPEAEQVTTCLPWLADLVLPDPAAVAGGSFLTSSWLIDIRTAASDVGLGAVWQQVVDALVVAGATRLAPYSE